MCTRHGTKRRGSQEEKKKFEKQTAKFVQSQERHLNLSTKKQDSVLQEVSPLVQSGPARDTRTLFWYWIPFRLFFFYLILLSFILSFWCMSLHVSLATGYQKGWCHSGDGATSLLPGESRVRLPPPGSAWTQKVWIRRNGNDPLFLCLVVPAVILTD